MGSKKTKIVAICKDKDQKILKSLDKEKIGILNDVESMESTEALSGLELARREDPDVVLVDANLPEMQSIELCEKIRTDKLLHDTPIIVLADAETDSEIRLKALDAGAVAFITEPFNAIDLKALVHVMAELKTARRRLSGRIAPVEIETLPSGESDDKPADDELSGMSLSEQMMKSIIEMVQDSIFVKDRSRRYVMINAAMARLWGLQEGAIAGKSDSELFGEAVGKNVQISDLRVLKGETIEEFPVKSIQGQIHHFHTIKMPLKDSKENIVGLCGIERDITENKEIEQKLHDRVNSERCAVQSIKKMAEEGDLENRIHAVLIIIRDMLKVSRAYVVVNEESSLRGTCRQRLEVCDKDITPRSDFLTFPGLTNSSSGLLSALQARKPYYGSVMKMTGEEREKLESQGVQSVLILPIYCESQLWGFIGLDDCHDERDWTAESTDVLNVIADNIGTSVQKWRVTNALRESESRYQTFIDASKDVIFVKDENYRYLIINKATLRFFNKSREEILFKTDSEIMDASAANRCSISDHKAITMGSMITCEERIGDRIFEVNKFPLVLRKNAIGVGAIIRDISDRKRSEAEHERLITAIEQLNEVIVITDPQGSIQYVNPAFDRVTGYSRDEVIGKNPRILKSGMQDDQFYKELWETILSGKTWQGQIINLHRDGSKYTEKATISPVFDRDGTITNFAAVKRNISEELRLTMQLQHAQKMESIGRLAGGVAHDFNNMLSVILGYSHMARDQVDPDQPVFSDLGEIIKAGTRAKEIAKQLLAFARIQTIEPIVLNLNDHIGDTLKMMQRLISEEIELIWSPAEKLWPIKMDPAQVDQILANLCVNAKDAINGVGTITIQTGNVIFDETNRAEHPAFPKGEYVFILVRDNGCGMGPEVFENLFEPFFTTKDINRGTGLGLATVYGIVKQNNGHISVDSNPGEGSVFMLFFPKYSGPDEKPGISPAESVPAGNGELILVVDDEKQIVNITKRKLEDLNYRVITAVTPEDAINMTKSLPEPIDVLVSDVIMPGNERSGIGEEFKKSVSEPENAFYFGVSGRCDLAPWCIRSGRSIFDKAVLEE